MITFWFREMGIITQFCLHSNKKAILEYHQCKLLTPPPFPNQKNFLGSYYSLSEKTWIYTFKSCNFVLGRFFFKFIYALKTYLLSNEEGMTLCWTKLNFKIDQIQHIQYLTENHFFNWSSENYDDLAHFYTIMHI